MIAADAAIEIIGVLPCDTTSSIASEFGVTVEPMIARTAHSYTYGQIEGAMKDFDYHGTLAVEPAGNGRSRLVYSLVYDQSKMASDAVRASEKLRMEGRFQGAVDKAKAIVEAGR